jgi:alpha/beta superfamily hydrolase
MDLELSAAKLEAHKIDGADHFWHGVAMQTLLDITGNWLDRK